MFLVQAIALVQHGVNKHTISNGARAWNIILLTFDPSIPFDCATSASLRDATRTLGTSQGKSLRVKAERSRWRSLSQRSLDFHLAVLGSGWTVLPSPRRYAMVQSTHQRRYLRKTT
ncbi:MAG: hypothetical protein V7K53_15610 [Nostoc sp.]|uniref:hypothetical protein n=1 Tax=Nostoc sp. TaxID=1180 RepID=UPI002FFB95E1